MYQTHPLRLSPEQVERVARLAETLDLRPGPGGSTASADAVTTPWFQAVLSEAFPAPWVRSMVMALWPSSQLVAHRDPPITGTRHHLPLRVNPGCWVFHAGTWQQLTAGQVYQMDPTDLHGAVNWGDTVRLHLVIDRE